MADLFANIESSIIRPALNFDKSAADADLGKTPVVSKAPTSNGIKNNLNLDILVKSLVLACTAFVGSRIVANGNFPFA